jgi:hypothetical protein
MSLVVNRADPASGSDTGALLADTGQLCYLALFNSKMSLLVHADG